MDEAARLMKGCWFRVSFPYVVRLEGNGLVSSMYKCPLSQELGCSTLFRKVR